MTVLTLHAKQDHLGKIASTRDPIKALAEFVWNALDADATRVAVDFVRNRLGGLDGVIVRDNGSGITHPRAELDFRISESLGSARPTELPVKERYMERRGAGAYGSFR